MMTSEGPWRDWHCFNDPPVFGCGRVFVVVFLVVLLLFFLLRFSWARKLSMVALDRAEQRLASEGGSDTSSFCIIWSCRSKSLKDTLLLAAFLSFESTRTTDEVCRQSDWTTKLWLQKLCDLDGEMLGSTTFYYSVLQTSSYNHIMTMFYQVLLCETN